LPLNIRFNAAVAASPFENPKMSDQRVLILEQRQKEIGQAELKRQQDEGDARLDELTRLWSEFVADRETEISALLEAGEITPKAADEIRRWHIPPERLALPPPSEPPLNTVNTDGGEPPAAPAARSTPPPPPPTAEPEPTILRTPTRPAAAIPAAPWLDGGLDRPAPPPASTEPEDLIEVVAGIDRNGRAIRRWMPRSRGGND